MVSAIFPSMNTALIWQQFEQFYLDYCVGYWSPERIPLSYGDFLPLHPADDASMLYAADLNKASPQTILAEIQALGRDKNLPVGFYISSSWQGNVDGFKEFLSEKGFRESHRMIPHILELSKADDIEESNFDVTPTSDAQLVASIFQEAFQCPTEMAQLISRHLERRNFEHHTTQFFLARTAEGKPAGVAGCSYNNQFGYLNCLSVLEPYRRLGCASQLVKARLNHLRKNNLTHAITTVAESNTGSLRTQAKNGYVPLTTVSVWTWTDEHVS
jgi:GNAT superfamily N-acetyltransferase